MKTKKQPLNYKPMSAAQQVAILIKYLAIAGMMWLIFSSCSPCQKTGCNATKNFVGYGK